MKKLLFIVGLLMGILLLAPGEDSRSSSELIGASREAVMKEKSSSDAQHNLEVLSNELKASNCLTPRRSLQTSGTSFDLRIHKTAVKLLHDTRLKGENQLCKVSENVSAYQTINFSSLLCRMGYHIYALRKILI